VAKTHRPRLALREGLRAILDRKQINIAALSVQRDATQEMLSIMGKCY
jgi:hypothetical protein